MRANKMGDFIIFLTGARFVGNRLTVFDNLRRAKAWRGIEMEKAHWSRALLICCAHCSEAFCRREKFSRMLAFLPGSKQEFWVFSYR